MAPRQLADEVHAVLVRFLTRVEGRRSSVYLDPVGLPTVGVGHRLLPGEQFPGELSDEEVLALLEADIAKALDCVWKSVDVRLNDWQLAALTSFTFNVGCLAFRKSTLRRKLNEGDYAAVPQQLRRWVFGRVPGSAEKVQLPGLITRREAEVELWLGGELT